MFKKIKGVFVLSPQITLHKIKHDRIHTCCTPSDLINVPVILTDINLKVLYKNSSATELGIKRIGSLITHLLSKEDVKYINRNNFDSIPCIFVRLNSNNNTVSAFVCRYPQVNNSLIWLIPSEVSLCDISIKSMMELIPDIVCHLGTEKTANSHAAEISYAKSVNMVLDYYISSISPNMTSLSTVKYILSGFFSHNKGISNCVIDISENPHHSHLYIREFRKLFILIVNIVLFLSTQGCLPFLRVYTKGDDLCFGIESCNDDIIKDPIGYTAFFNKLCFILGYEFELDHGVGEKETVIITIKAKLLMPDRLHQQENAQITEDNDHDLNEFLTELTATLKKDL